MLLHILTGTQHGKSLTRLGTGFNVQQGGEPACEQTASPILYESCTGNRVYPA